MQDVDMLQLLLIKENYICGDSICFIKQEILEMTETKKYHKKLI